MTAQICRFPIIPLLSFHFLVQNSYTFRKSIYSTIRNPISLRQEPLFLIVHKEPSSFLSISCFLSQLGSVFDLIAVCVASGTYLIQWGATAIIQEVRACSCCLISVQVHKGWYSHPIQNLCLPLTTRNGVDLRLVYAGDPLDDKAQTPAYI